MLDAFDFETQGRPTITVCHDTFARAARNHASAMGLPDLPLLIEPAPRSGNLTTDPGDTAERNFDRVVAALTARPA